MTTKEISQEDYKKDFSGKESEALEHALDIRKFENGGRATGIC